MSGINSEDKTVKEIRNLIAETEKAIALMIAQLPVTVWGMEVHYNRSTSRNPEDAVFTDGRSAGVHVILNYRI